MTAIKRSGSPLESDRPAPRSDTHTIPPHNPEDEAKPNLPMFHPAARRAETLANEANQKIQDFIIEAAKEYDDPSLPELLDLVKRSQYAPYSTSERTVMVNGEAGKGKSFTLNNALGHRNLSIQAGGPKGCTNVATSYHRPEPSQRAPFMARINIYSDTRAKDLVKKYFTDFINYTNHIKKRESEDESDSEEANDEAAELEQRSDSAVTALTALFCADHDFRNKEATEQYLSAVESLEDKKVIKCQAMIEDIISQLKGKRSQANAEGSVPTFEAADVSLLRNRIEPFITDTTDSFLPGTSLQCSPWPIVESISLGVASRVLQSGVIIVDIPGIGDTNTSHVDKARQSLQGADIIVIIADIERVAANSTVEKELRWAYRRRGANGVIMVCTKTDANIDNDIGTQFTPEERQVLSALESKMEETDRMICETRQSKDQAISENDLARMKQLTIEEKSLLMSKQELSNSHLETRILARNRTATDLILEKYRRWAKPDDPPLPIFCVSNTEYDKYLRGYRSDSTPHLSLQATGIPSFTKHISSLAAIGRFKALEYHVKDNADIMLNRLDMYCTSSPNKRKSKVIGLCSLARMANKKEIAANYKKFSDESLDIMKREMAKQESSWADYASNKCDKWDEKVHPKSFSAIIKRNGIYNGNKKIGKQDWDAELLVPVMKTLDSLFCRLQGDWAFELAKNVGDKAGKAINNLSQELRKDPESDVAAFNQAFLSNLQLREEEVERTCREQGQKLARKFRSIQDLAATTGDDSYFPSFMVRVYSKACSAKRVGRRSLHSARSQKFRQALVAKAGPFHLLQVRILEECKKAVDAHCIEMTKSVEKVFKAIEDDVDQACLSRDDDSIEGKIFRKKLLALVNETRRKRAEEILPALQEAIVGGYDLTDD